MPTPPSRHDWQKLIREGWGSNHVRILEWVAFMLQHELTPEYCCSRIDKGAEEYGPLDVTTMDFPHEMKEELADLVNYDFGEEMKGSYLKDAPR